MPQPIYVYIAYFTDGTQALQPVPATEHHGLSCFHQRRVVHNAERDSGKTVQSIARDKYPTAKYSRQSIMDRCDAVVQQAKNHQ